MSFAYEMCARIDDLFHWFFCGSGVLAYDLSRFAKRNVESRSPLVGPRILALAIRGETPLPHKCSPVPSATLSTLTRRRQRTWRFRLRRRLQQRCRLRRLAVLRDAIGGEKAPHKIRLQHVERGRL